MPLECHARQQQIQIPFRSGTTVNHLLYVDDIKLYAKSKRDIDLRVHLTKVFSTDNGMTFSLGKCGCLIVSRGKIKHTNRVEMPNGHLDGIAESYKRSTEKQYLNKKTE